MVKENAAFIFSGSSGRWGTGPKVYTQLIPGSDKVYQKRYHLI
jgi:hypothetical protein